MTLPKISVIIPTFNRHQFLDQTIECILNQDYENLEIIVVDGGSEEETLNEIKRYIKKIDIFISEKDYGMWHALNKGILSSTGCFIYLLNSDDLLFDSALNKIGNYICQNPNVDLVYGESARIDSKGEIFGWHGAIPFNRDLLLHRKNYIPTQACFFRKNALARVGLFDTKLIWNGDWDMWKRFAKTPGLNILFLNEPIGKWRIYENTLSYSGGSKEFYKKYVETFKNARKHSLRIITPIEIELLPYIIVGFLRIRKILKVVINVFSKTKNK